MNKTSYEHYRFHIPILIVQFPPATSCRTQNRSMYGIVPGPFPPSA